MLSSISTPQISQSDSLGALTERRLSKIAHFGLKRAGPVWVDGVEKVAADKLWNMNAQQSNRGEWILNQHAHCRLILNHLARSDEQNRFSTASTLLGSPLIRPRGRPSAAFDLWRRRALSEGAGGFFASPISRSRGVCLGVGRFMARAYVIGQRRCPQSRTPAPGDCRGPGRGCGAWGPSWPRQWP